MVADLLAGGGCGGGVMNALEPRDPIATEITREHEAACQAVRSGLEHARRAGALLIAAKAGLDYGAWLPWLVDQCPTLPARTAQVYMRVARRWSELEAAADGNTQRVTDLPLRQVIAFLADPRERTPISEDSSEIDVPALRRALADDEEDARRSQRELEMLALALKSPGLTIKAASSIYHRADEIEGYWHAKRINGLADLGRMLNRAEADLPGSAKIWLEFLACPEALREFIATAEAGPLEGWHDRLVARIADLTAAAS